MPLMQSSGSLMQGGESLSDAAELFAEITEITIDAYCEHRLAVQCVVDNPSACSAESEGILEYASKLDCLCDACPSAKTALADFTGTLMNAFGTALSGFSGDGTTTQAFVADTTTDMSDGWLDDMTDADLQMMCAVYPLLSCSINFPAQCGGDIIFDGLDMSDMTTDSEQTDSLALMEDMCPSTTALPSADDDDSENSNDESADEDETSNDDDNENSNDESADENETNNDDDNENSNDESADEDEISNCGPISLGWLSVSLLLAVAALTFEAV